MTDRHRFGEFEFDAATGELFRWREDDVPLLAARLQPQPARLLALLIERRGELLSHEEIRRGLWPDSEVEFDQGLHFCVRRIRAALGDSAADPRYVQTLPRRGYRLLVPVSEAAAPIGAAPTPRSPRRRRFSAIALAASALIVLVVILGAWPRPVSVTIAIMPFTPADGTSSPIATLLVERLAGTPGLGVVGPTTTERYAGSLAPLSDAARELEVAYLVNGRFVTRDGREGVLGELIRADDGVHVWVQWFEDPGDATAISETIAREVRRTLALPGT